MPLTTLTKDPEALTMTVTCDYEAPIDRVWALWADPRKLERWWGPPSYPATFTEHDLRAGGKSAYYMTGPEGDRHAGWWEFVSVDPPREIHARDGFADADGNPMDGLPQMSFRVTLIEAPVGHTCMTVVTQFPSVEEMNQLLEMGMEEGFSSAVGQADAILAE